VEIVKPKAQIDADLIPCDDRFNHDGRIELRCMDGFTDNPVNHQPRSDALASRPHNAYKLMACERPSCRTSSRWDHTVLIQQQHIDRSLIGNNRDFMLTQYLTNNMSRVVIGVWGVDVELFSHDMAVIGCIGI